jgi:hypothetical protein
MIHRSCVCFCVALGLAAGACELPDDEEDCSPTATPDPTQVVLNEVMAVQPDWIELYNPADRDLELEGLVLWSEDDGYGGGQEPWAFPPGAVIEAGGFVVVVCDHSNDSSLDELHASFRINRAGGELWLSRVHHPSCGEGTPQESIEDRVLYPAQHGTASWARVPDGGDSWMWGVPTREAPNRAAP